MLCIATLLAVCSECCLAQKSSLQTPKNSSPKIPSDGKPFVSYDSEVVFNAAAHGFSTSQRDKLTRLVLAKNSSEQELFIPFEKELLADSSKPHFATLVSKKPISSGFLNAGTLQLRSGDIVILEQPSIGKLLLVYAAERKFPNAKVAKSFFLYPYETGVEFNSFPARLHPRLATALKQPTERVVKRKDEFRSWFTTSVAGTLKGTYLKTRWRAGNNATVSVYRIKAGAIRRPERIVLKRPNDLLCHKQLTPMTCQWATMAQGKCYVSSSKNPSAEEFRLVDQVLLGSSYRDMIQLTCSHVFSSEHSPYGVGVRAEIRQIKEADAKQLGIPPDTLGKALSGAVLNNAEFITVVKGVAHRIALRQGKGDLYERLKTLCVYLQAREIFENGNFMEQYRQFLREASQSGSLPPNKFGGIFAALSARTQADFGFDSTRAKALVDHLLGCGALDDEGIWFYHSNANMVMKNAATIASLSHTVSRRVEKDSLIGEIKSQLKADRPVRVSIMTSQRGRSTVVESFSLMEAGFPIQRFVGSSKFPHDVLVVGYFGFPGKEEYLYVQDGIGLTRGDAPVHADFENGCSQIYKIRLEEFLERVRFEGVYWDTGTKVDNLLLFP
jgi:hypothetical protein